MKASLRLYLCEDWLEGVIRLKAYTETHSCLTPCGDFINKSGSVSELGCSWAVAGLGWSWAGPGLGCPNLRNTANYTPHFFPTDSGDLSRRQLLFFS